MAPVFQPSVTLTHSFISFAMLSFSTLTSSYASGHPILPALMQDREQKWSGHVASASAIEDDLRVCMCRCESWGGRSGAADEGPVEETGSGVVKV